MRLIEYQYLLNSCVEKLLNYEKADRNIGGTSKIQLSNFKEPMPLVVQLKNNGLFSETCELLISRYDYLLTTMENSVIMDVNSFQDFHSLMNKLHSLVKELKETIDKVVHAESENTINFKLPDDINDMESLVLFSKDLNDSLMFYSKLKIEPKFQGFDTGTSWIQLLIDSHPVIMFTFQLLVGFLSVAKLYLETEKSWDDRIERKKKDKLKKENIEFLETMKKEELDEYVQKEDKIIKEIMIDSNIAFKTDEETNEFINATRLSMRKMAKLFNRGMKICPALSSSQEIKSLSTNVQEQISAYQKISIGIKDIKAITTHNIIEEETKQDDKV